MRGTQTWPPASAPASPATPASRPASGDGPHGDRPKLVGYARVSMREQHPELQQDALRQAGCKQVFTDKGASGKLASRPELDRCLAELREGDVLVVWKLDRLGRSVKNVLTIAEDLHEHGIGLRILTGRLAGTYTPSGEGKFFFTLMAAVAELERDFTIERTLAGLAVAAAKGHKGGRKRALTAEQEDLAIEMVQGGKHVTQVARSMGVSKTTLYRVFERRGLTEPGDQARQRKDMVTPEAADQILALLAEGHNYAAVAEETGYSHMTVRRVWKDAGNTGPPPGAGRPRDSTKPGGRPPALTRKQQRLAADMIAAGKPVAEVARKLGVGRATIYRVMDDKTIKAASTTAT